jgi:hypothetical protein
MQPLGNARPARRRKRRPREVGVEPGAPRHLGACGLRKDVAHKRMAADAHDVARLPAFRSDLHRGEFWRQESGLAPGEVDEGIDAGCEGVGDALGLRRAVGVPFRRHVAAIEEQPRRAILRQEARPKVGRHAPKPALAPQIELPQPVARRVEALDKEHIAPRRRANMRDAPAIDDDLGIPLQPRNLELDGFRRFFPAAHDASPLAASRLGRRRAGHVKSQPVWLFAANELLQDAREIRGWPSIAVAHVKSDCQPGVNGNATGLPKASTITRRSLSRNPPAW